MLNYRIQIQKIIQFVNRLPPPDVFKAYLHSNKDLESLIHSKSLQLFTFLDSFITLQRDLLEKNTNVPLTSKKRKLDPASSSDFEQALKDAYAEMTQIDTACVPFREETIEKWNQKVRMASGIPLQKKFKVVNQSINSQIHHLLQDKERLIKRSQLRRSNLALFDLDGSYQPESLDTSQNYDPSIYDDDDFYQEQLKDLIEARMSQAGTILLLFFFKKK